MPRRPTLTIVEHVKELEKLSQGATEAQVEAVLKDPAASALKVADLLEQWKNITPDEILKSDPEYLDFKKKITRQMLVETFMSLRLAHDALVKELQQKEYPILPKDLSSIMTDLGRQIKLLNEMQEAIPGFGTRNIEELDQKIAQMEQELRDSEQLDS